MRDCCQIFSDIFAHRDNYLSRIHVRVKLLFTLASVILIISSQGVFLPVAMSIFSLAILSTISIPLRLLSFRMLAPLWIAAVLMVIQLFSSGEQSLFELQVFFWRLTAYREGLERGALLASKVLGAGSMLIFLSMTTPANQIFACLRSFRVPPHWVEVAMFTYRYIFVFIDDLTNVKDAQRLRLGYSNWRRGMNSFGILAGSVLLSAYDQANSTFQAMRLRGYTGEMPYLFQQRFYLKDFMAALAFFGTLIALKAVPFAMR